MSERSDQDRQTGAETGSEHDGEQEGTERPREIGGRKGPEPTRYGDWEKNGRCIDF
jgi:hypothetical protein